MCPTGWSMVSVVSLLDFSTSPVECGFLPRYAEPMQLHGSCFSWLALLSFSIVACGEDQAQTFDAATQVDATVVVDAMTAALDAAALDAAVPDAAPTCTDLTILDDGSITGIPDLVVSELNPGDYIELHNTTALDIPLGTVTHQLCSPFSYTGLAALAANVTVPAGGFATVPWPAAFIDVDAGGEVILYSSAAFGDSTAILDFMCWGDNPHQSRKSQAESNGKWTGACAAALANGAMHRITNTNGITAASYDTAGAADPTNCSP